MPAESEKRQLFDCFATMLEYPAGTTIQAAREALGMLAGTNPEAARLLNEFLINVEGLTRGRLEEVYTGTFDLDAACHPYAGYHLFGETYKRSAFMIELKERYRAHGFEPSETELPDHLATILRFLALTEDRSLADEIARDALLPALDRMTGRAKSSGFDDPDGASAVQNSSEKRHPFQVVLESLRCTLLTEPETISI